MTGVVLDAERPSTVSLVISTLGDRPAELRRCLRSIAWQSYPVAEVIIVHQGAPMSSLSAMSDEDWPFAVTLLDRPLERGLSRGRNVGCKVARSDIVGFPDDDCWYPPSFVQTALSLLDRTKADFVTGRAADESGRTINGRFAAAAQTITRRNVFETQIEWVALFRRAALDVLGGYEESIGIGAATPWQSCEGQDLALRAIAAGLSGYYDPKLCGHHAELDIRDPDLAMRRKGRAYGRGMGHVLRRHGYGWAHATWRVLRPAGGAVLNAARARWARADYYRNVALGRFEGYLR